MVLAAAARLVWLDVVGVVRGKRGSVGVRALHEVIVDGLAAAHRRCWHVSGDVVVGVFLYADVQAFTTSDHSTVSSILA